MMLHDLFSYKHWLFFIIDTLKYQAFLARAVFDISLKLNIVSLTRFISRKLMKIWILHLKLSSSPIFYLHIQLLTSALIIVLLNLWYSLHVQSNQFINLQTRTINLKLDFTILRFIFQQYVSNLKAFQVLSQSICFLVSFT